jgi:uncharacterized damage-inducible protein DinB
MSVFTNPSNAAEGHAQAYVAAVLDLLGDRDPLDVLKATPGALDRIVASTPAEMLRTPEMPGKWSMGQVLAHLADSDLVWGWRLRLVVAQDRPPLTGYDQDAWADRLGYAAAEPPRSVARFRVLREDNLWLIDRCSPADLERVGVHVERGEESLAHHLRLYAGHDLLHLNQLARIRERVKGQGSRVTG